MKDSLKQIGQAVTNTVIEFIKRLASKKFFAWVIATHMTYIDLLAPSFWMTITLVWLGIQGGIDYKKFIADQADHTAIQPNNTGEPVPPVSS